MPGAQRIRNDVALAVTLPLLLRNRLAELILEALHDGEARRTLERVAAGHGELAARPADVGDAREDRDERQMLTRERARSDAELRERARRAWLALDGRVLDPPEPSPAAALASAGVLFDAGLYFETHELLEPYWQRAAGPARVALQGFIQIAVGFQHLANGNATGARALLEAGSAKTGAGRVEGLDLRAFTRAVRGCLAELTDRADDGRDFDWTTVPPFPRSDAGGRRKED